MKPSTLARACAGLLFIHMGAQAAKNPASVSQTFAPNPLEAGSKAEQVSVEVKTTDHLRSFTLTSTQEQRDNTPKTRTVTENNLYPRVHTNNPMFDALYAMSVDDLRLDSVSAIRDSSYNNGNAINCNCFETGEKWNYVWTRDLSYSVNLSLAQLDPARSVNSLLFKTSGFREQITAPANLPKNSLQIIQDTGSGGSWPVSTDRVTWALGAQSVLQNLSGDERTEFLNKAFLILTGTIEADRLAVFDESSGLYGGEQSYMDWRTQTYAPWIVNNLSYMAQSKALSTNVLHYHAIKLAADIAREKNDPRASQYDKWAADLKQKINEKFWLDDVGLYSTATTSAEDTAPVYKYDMLGNALAILLDIASPEQAQKIIARYPNTAMGVPVYYPQMPNVYVYHNRSMWPFVTAYALNAAVKVGNNKAVNNAIQSIWRGTALNLSNMENLEWLTGKPYYDDGPAISSRRQLWSVAAYLGMVTNTVFGVQTSKEGISFKPFLTQEILALLGGGKQATLDNIRYKGKQISVNLQLPKAEIEAGVFPVREIRLNGKPVLGVISDVQLKANNTVQISFGKLDKNPHNITMADNVNPRSHDDAKVFSPEAPTNVKILLDVGKFMVKFDAATNSNKDDLVFTIYKNGQAVAKQISTKQWLDKEAANTQIRNCFTVESEFVPTGNKSLHSEPVCDYGSDLQFIPVTDKRTLSNLKPTDDKQHYELPVLLEWGGKGDQLQVNNIEIKTPGHYAVQVIYNNRQHTIDSGVTNAVKTIALIGEQNKTLSTGVIQMPNVQDSGNKYPLRSSTEFKVALEKGKYALQFGDFFNMSYLSANATYKGNGGATGPINKASIAGVRIFRVE